MVCVWLCVCERLSWECECLCVCVEEREREKSFFLLASIMLGTAQQKCWQSCKSNPRKTSQCFWMSTTHNNALSLSHICVSIFCCFLGEKAEKLEFQMTTWKVFFSFVGQKNCFVALKIPFSLSLSLTHSYTNYIFLCYSWLKHNMSFIRTQMGF